MRPSQFDEDADGALVDELRGLIQERSSAAKACTAALGGAAWGAAASVELGEYLS